MDPLTDPWGLPRALPGGGLLTSPMFPVYLNGLLGLALGLASLLGMLFFFVWASRPRPQAPAPAVAGPPPRRDWLADAEALAVEVRAHRDYRRGAHELGRLMEAWSEARIGDPLDAWTVDEVASRLSEREVGFWRRVRAMAFGADMPKAREFDALCETFRVEICGPPATNDRGRAR